MKPAVKSSAKSFQATLETTRSRLNWVIVRIPFDAAKLWGTRGQVRVKGEINGFPFRTSLFPTGTGQHVLLVNKRMQTGAKVRVGGTARFRLEPDTEPRTITVPAELRREIAENRALVRWFDQLSYSTRKWLTGWIDGVKSAEARARRARQVAEQLLAAMDAERELPPVLRIAFAKNPRAWEGWKLMPPSHRRQYLLAIFYYQKPDAQARRIQKAMQQMREFLEKRAKKPAPR
ncbi:MAG: hypothetical protein C5B51_16345 [Terriglobia bacterium]|nr:MAG: hypothetical protein C5B51_16345 [Terriglobia bacterium]